jgi:phosphoribosylamine--glycine ligase/phosphoribosylglycinamide formyltransferase/phosphoribosylformylglycinamidine cyclo-ligase
LKDHSALAAWCKEQNIALVVVGPEDPLADGIADDLQSAGAVRFICISFIGFILLCISGIPCFGPSTKAAEIESSKAFAKDFMNKYGISTARGQSFETVTEAQNFINEYMVHLFLHIQLTLLYSVLTSLLWLSKRVV